MGENNLIQGIENEVVNYTDKGNDQELFVLAQSGCKEAREKLILANQGLVVFLVKKYKGIEELSDLIQEGNLGLMKAIDRFDPKLGYSFSTYASWWIKQSIQHYLFRVKPRISINKNKWIMILRMNSERQKLMQKWNRDVKEEELAEKMQISLNEIRELQKIAFDCMIYEENDFKKGLYKEEFKENLHDEIIQKQMVEYLRQYLFLLNERERKVILYHYGVFGNEQMTLQKIADQMGLCKERIRQIEIQAIKKLKLFFEKGIIIKNR